MTDEEIRNLTDEQINVMVTKCAYNVNDHEYVAKGKEIALKSGVSVCNGVLYSAINGLSFYTVKDYCNDPAAMWPIMVDSCISVFIEKGLTKHVACVSEWADCAFNIQLETYDANPLRAAAIVYLKIKGVL